MKKIIILIISILLPIIILLAVFVAIISTLDFFGTSTTDGYVEDNMEYASDYRKVLNDNIQNGYVPLERILYFYLEDDNLSFSKIYQDNLDFETKRMLPITDVCLKDDYKNMVVCSEEEIEESNQIKEFQNKPFDKPIDFSKVNITSIFMEQRIVFNNYGVHKAWDLASPSLTNVYAVCDGIIEKVSFPYKENVPDKSGGGGNQIVLRCEFDDVNYKVSYYHLYPESYKVSVNDEVVKGQLLAGVGNTGSSTGDHLHYQVEIDNKYIDGMSLIDFTTNLEDENSFQQPFVNP